MKEPMSPITLEGADDRELLMMCYVVITAFAQHMDINTETTRFISYLRPHGEEAKECDTFSLAALLAKIEERTDNPTVTRLRRTRPN